jgi:hypothetical protein
MRALLAQLLGLDPAHYAQGRMSYDLRRLRLHALIERIPYSHRRTHSPWVLRAIVLFLPLHPALATYPPRHRSQRDQG